jgi:hypothetical protein
MPEPVLSFFGYHGYESQEPPNNGIVFYMKGMARK